MPMDEKTMRNMVVALRREMSEWAPDLTPRKLEHLLGMLPKMVAFIDAGRREKFMRWGGFVQGALWYADVLSLEQAKTMNMPPDATYDPERDATVPSLVTDVPVPPPQHMRTWRREVIAFADLMEARLHEKDLEHGEAGWKEYGWYFLSGRLLTKYNEMRNAVNMIDRVDYSDRTKMRAKVRQAAVDVANFAMMIADTLGGLEVDGPGDGG